MFNYSEDVKKLKELRTKIYNKQKYLLDLMYTNKIDFQDISIRKYINEINLLEEIFEVKKDYFLEDSKIFWNEKHT